MIVYARDIRNGNRSNNMIVLTERVDDDKTRWFMNYGKFNAKDDIEITKEIAKNILMLQGKEKQFRKAYDDGYECGFSCGEQNAKDET